MDEKFVEQAEENVRRAIEAEIAAISKRPKLQATGTCYNCLENVDEERLFCDVDCKDDWEYRNKRGRA